MYWKCLPALWWLRSTPTRACKDSETDWLPLGSRPHGPDAPRPLMTGPLCPVSIYGSPVALLKFQMAPSIIHLMSSGSKKKEPRYVCLSKAKASHSQRLWAEVSSSALKDSENSSSDLVTDIPCHFRIPRTNCTFTNSSPLSRFHAPTIDALQFSGNPLHRHMTFIWITCQIYSFIIT
jgi:hypothetical protein